MRAQVFDNEERTADLCREVVRYDWQHEGLWPFNRIPPLEIMLSKDVKERLEYHRSAGRRIVPLDILIGEVGHMTHIKRPMP